MTRIGPVVSNDENSDDAQWVVTACEQMLSRVGEKYNEECGAAGGGGGSDSGRAGGGAGRGVSDDGGNHAPK
jgi:hypothetical protein